jgi:hypothetical protein
MSITNNDLTMTSGRPLSQIIRVVDAKLIWPTLVELEVRAQLRTGKTSNDALIANLHDYMTWDFDDDDLVITWTMTGEQTRDLYALTWGELKRGYFNVIVSDTGTEDARALVVPTVTLKAVSTTTAASGDA